MGNSSPVHPPARLAVGRRARASCRVAVRLPVAFRAFSPSEAGMAVDVRTEIVIDLPRDRVAGYAIDPSHAPEWYANIASVEWETPGPLGVGSRLAFVARFLGRRLAYTYE